MPGYDALRALLCKKAILVEGASDELVVQKAYKNRYDRLPIEDGVDVISVGTAFQRFLALADALDLAVTVVTDNDGKPENLRQKYAQYMTTDRKNSRVKICFDFEIDEDALKIVGKPYNYNTLESKMIKADGDDLALFNRILGKQFNDVGSVPAARSYSASGMWR